MDTRPLFPKVHAALLHLLAMLNEEEWKLPTVCEGWTPGMSLFICSALRSGTSRGAGMEWRAILLLAKTPPCG